MHAIGRRLTLLLLFAQCPFSTSLFSRPWQLKGSREKRLGIISSLKNEISRGSLRVEFPHFGSIQAIYDSTLLEKRAPIFLCQLSSSKKLLGNLSLMASYLPSKGASSCSGWIAGLKGESWSLGACFVDPRLKEVSDLSLRLRGFLIIHLKKVQGFSESLESFHYLSPNFMRTKRRKPSAFYNDHYWGEDHENKHPKSSTAYDDHGESKDDKQANIEYKDFAIQTDPENKGTNLSSSSYIQLPWTITHSIIKQFVYARERIEEILTDAVKPYTEAPAESNESIQGGSTSARPDLDLLASMKVATSARDSLTSTKVATSASDPVASMKVATSASDSLTSVKVATSAPDPVASMKVATSASDSLTSVKVATSAPDPVASMKVATSASDSLTSVKVATSAPDPVASMKVATSASDSLTSMKVATSASDSLASTKVATSASDSLTSTKVATSAPDSSNPRNLSTLELRYENMLKRTPPPAEPLLTRTRAYQGNQEPSLPSALPLGSFSEKQPSVKPKVQVQGESASLPKAPRKKSSLSEDKANSHRRSSKHRSKASRTLESILSRRSLKTPPLPSATQPTDNQALLNAPLSSPYSAWPPCHCGNCATIWYTWAIQNQSYLSPQDQTYAIPDQIRASKGPPSSLQTPSDRTHPSHPAEKKSRSSSLGSMPPYLPLYGSASTQPRSTRGTGVSDSYSAEAPLSALLTSTSPYQGDPRSYEASLNAPSFPTNQPHRPAHCARCGHTHLPIPMEPVSIDPAQTQGVSSFSRPGAQVTPNRNRPQESMVETAPLPPSRRVQSMRLTPESTRLPTPVGSSIKATDRPPLPPSQKKLLHPRSNSGAGENTEIKRIDFKVPPLPLGGLPPKGASLSRSSEGASQEAAEYDGGQGFETCRSQISEDKTDAHGVHLSQEEDKGSPMVKVISRGSGNETPRRSPRQ